MASLAAYELPGPEQRRLAAVVSLPDGDEPIVLRTSTGTIELPPAASAAVRQLLETLASGTAVHVVADDAELTTQQAATLLGMSRTYLARLVDQGKLPAHRVGSHRRLKAADVLAYKAHRQARLRAVDAVAIADRYAGVPYR